MHPYMMRPKSVFKLLTFYKFVDVADPHWQVAEHKAFCHDIGLQWRVYIGEEGISSTVTGNTRQLRAYRQYLEQNSYFHGISDIDTKATIVPWHCFSKMIVKYRSEIVALGKTYSAKTISHGGQRMSIEDFKRIMDSNTDDYVILDMRNTYEYKLGHFKNAIPAWTINFRELDTYIDLYKKKFEGKKVVTYCTGGIRCEKATVLMREFGIDQVYQLDGWVMKYINSFNDGNWLGNLYTFDGRVSMMVGDKKTHQTIGRCIYSGEKTDHCENCRYSPCNARIIAKKKVYKQHLGFCSQECFDKAKSDWLVRDVSFDPFDYSALRRLYKQWSITNTEMQEKLAKHMNWWIKDVVFEHQSSQKEEYIDSWLLEQSVLCAH